jgi:hypothetical protein
MEIRMGEDITANRALAKKTFGNYALEIPKGLRE